MVSVDTVADLVARNPVPNERVLLSGLRTAGDFGAQRIVRHDPDSVAATNLGCVFGNAGTGRYLAEDCESGEVDVRWFGAVGDASTDCSDAIRSAYSWITNRFYSAVNSNYVNVLTTNTNPNLNPGTGTNLTWYRVAPAVLKFPAGIYRVTTNDLFSKQGDDPAGMAGLHIKGDSPYATTVYLDYEASTAGNYLIYNDDKLPHLRISSIAFQSASVSNSFLASIASPVARPTNLRFEDVHFLGNWDTTLYFDGDNNNSENTFIGCRWAGNFGHMMKIEDGANGNTILHLFDDCTFWQYNTTGTNFYIGGGGNVTFQNCKSGGFGEGAYHIMQRTASPGTAFPGQERLSIIGGRYETQQNTNLVFIDADISLGELTISDVTLGTQSTYFIPTNHPLIVLRNTYAVGPKVLVQNSTIPGQIQFIVGRAGVAADTARLGTRNVVFDNVEFFKHDTPDTVFLFEYLGTGTVTNAYFPHVALRNCRGNVSTTTIAIDGHVMGSRYVQWNADINWQYRQGFSPQEKAVSLRRTPGDFTFTSAEMAAGGNTNWALLPPHAIVTRVDFSVEANRFAQASMATWTVKDFSGYTYMVPYFSPTNGFTNIWIGNRYCGTAVSNRLIQLEPTSNVLQTGSTDGANCIVYYK